MSLTWSALVKDEQINLGSCLLLNVNTEICVPHSSQARNANGSSTQMELLWHQQGLASLRSSGIEVSTFDSDRHQDCMPLHRDTY